MTETTDVELSADDLRTILNLIPPHITSPLKDKLSHALWASKLATRRAVKVGDEYIEAPEGYALIREEDAADIIYRPKKKMQKRSELYHQQGAPWTEEQDRFLIISTHNALNFLAHYTSPEQKAELAISYLKEVGRSADSILTRLGVLCRGDTVEPSVRDRISVLLLDGGAEISDSMRATCAAAKKRQEAA